MKKSGCFFTSIILITIIIGIIFYISKNYGPQLWEAGKEKLFSFAEKDIKEKLDNLKSNEYKDSLIVLVNSQLKYMKDLNFEEVKNDSFHFFEKIEEFINDKVIDSDELAKLTEIYKKYER